MKCQTPKLLKLSMCIMLGLGIIPQSSYAAEEEEVEVITVTGVLGSIKAATLAKRHSDSIIDSLATEDIGKFPDSNVAEALQRISGVSIDRAGGEGQGVTVRGFGPQFNAVTVNGRRLASDSGTRAFNFDLISSEMIAGADVYKSSNASLTEGGIGSVINLKTLRPLAIGEFKGLASIKGNYEDQSEKWSPNLFGLISNTFADDTLGVMLSVSHQERDSVRDYVEAAQWIQTDDTFNGNADTFWVPRKSTVTHDEQKRTRTGFNTAIQYAPSDNILISVDTLYSELDVESDGVELAYFSNPATATLLNVDENNVVTNWDFETAPEIVNLTFNRPSKIEAYGFNFDWDVSDTFKAVLDISHSKAEKDAGGKDNYFVIQGPRSTLRIDDSKGYDTPLASIISTPNRATPFNRSETDSWTSWWTNRAGDTDTDEITEVKLDTTWELELGPLVAVKAGVAHSTQEFNHIARSTASGFYYGSQTVNYPSSLFTPAKLDNFLSSANTPFVLDYVKVDSEELIAYLESDIALTQRDTKNNLAAGTSAAGFPATGYDAILKPGSTYSVEEDNLALYVEGQFEAEVGDMFLVVNAGLRYIETDLKSTGTQSVLRDLMLQGVGQGNQTDQYLSDFGDSSAVSASSSYSELLPSLNAKLDISEDWIARFAYSKTLTRPDLAKLRPQVSYPDTIRVSAPTVSGSNPGLEPYISNNIDLSLEWYFAETSYASVAYFQKDIDGFIVNGIANEQIPIANSQNISDQNISGNFATFAFDRPRNLESTKVDGFEITFQHTFGDLDIPVIKNMGVLANITVVNTDDEFDKTSFNNTLALPGLSDSQNIVLFYEDDKLELRLAYNNRDEFFKGFVTATEPEFVKDYSQIDFRAAYNITEDYQFFLEGVNIGNEAVESIGRYESQFLRHELSGARYTVGVRATF